MSSTLDRRTASAPGVITTMTNAGDDHTKTSSLAQKKHQMLGNHSHHKRGAWRQMALRTRQGSNPHHQDMLYILQEAAKDHRAKAANNQVDCTSYATTSETWSDDHQVNIPVQARLNHVEYNNGATQAYPPNHASFNSCQSTRWYATGQSHTNHSRSRIEENRHKKYADDDDMLFVPEELARPTSSEPKEDNNDWDTALLHLDKTESIGGLQTSTCTPMTNSEKRNHVPKTVSEEKKSCTLKHHSRWSAVSMIQINDDIQMATTMGHTSLNSYLRPPTMSSHNHSRDQFLNDLIDLMLEGDDDDDDDDVSFAESLMEEESINEKNISHLHRSEGTLDFRGTLQHRAANFHTLNGTIPTSCFHLSLGSSSRWDDGLPDPTTMLLLPPKDQLTVSKAAVSTYLPVRQPPRKLSPSDVAVTSNMGSNRTNNSPGGSTIFSSTESTEPSPIMPLRKASSHGTTHSTFQRKDGERSYISSIPVPPLTRHESQSSRGTFLESSSPQLPIRDVSTHHAAHFRHGDKTLTCIPALQTCVPASEGTILEDGPIQQPQRKSSTFPPTEYKEDI